MALKMRRLCFGSHDQGKIVDFEQTQRNMKDSTVTIADRMAGNSGNKKTTRTTKTTHSSSPPLNLAELVPRDTFGFESVFQIEKVKEMDILTGTIGHPIYQVSLVAKTSVEILFIPKRDFFLFTSYTTRKTMRQKLCNPKLKSLGYYSRIFKNPTEAINKQKLWNAYKTKVTEAFEFKHAKYALTSM